MSTELDWIAPAASSCWHALSVLEREYPVVDDRLARALGTQAAELFAWADEAGLPRRALIDQLAALSCQTPNALELARWSLAKAAGREAAERRASELSPRIAAIQAAATSAVPDLAEQLQLRTGPLRELWESRGPGLLAALARLTEPELIVTRGQVLTVYPTSGGGGMAYAACNRVAIEAVLTDVAPGLPEVVRLGWLLAQLELDRPVAHGALAPRRAMWLGRRAMAAATLEAASQVEWCAAGERALAVALVAWRMSTPDRAAATASALSAWWGEYQSSRPRWAIAIGALDRLLPE